MMKRLLVTFIFIITSSNIITISSSTCKPYQMTKYDLQQNKAFIGTGLIVYDSSKLKCAKECSYDATCIGFNHKSKSQCQLVKTSSSGSVQAQDPSQQILYSKKVILVGGESPECVVTIFIPRNAANNQRCVFPFYFDKEWHNKCIMVRTEYLWCSVTKYYVGKWGNCFYPLKTIYTTGGNANGAPCHFPYWYDGADRYTCSIKKSEKPWCATTRSLKADGLWGNCNVPVCNDC